MLISHFLNISSSSLSKCYVFLKSVACCSFSNCCFILSFWVLLPHHLLILACTSNFKFLFLIVSLKLISRPNLGGGSQEANILHLLTWTPALYTLSVNQYHTLVIFLSWRHKNNKKATLYHAWDELVPILLQCKRLN